MKKIYIIGVLSMFTLMSCSDFLDLKPISQASKVSFYKTEADVVTGLNACYAKLQSTQQYAEYFITLMEVRSDNLEDQNPGGNAGRDYNIDQFTAGSDNAAIRDSWASIYNLIYRCNDVLANLDIVASQENRNRYEGELRFLRALSYFNVVRLWGAAPLILKPITTDDSKHCIRNSVDDIYKAIEEDLLFASGENHLPKTYTIDSEKGRVTSGAALALLGKVYLTEKKYQRAVDVLRQFVDRDGSHAGVYNLVSKISQVFNVENELNIEMMFVVRFSKTIVGEGRNFPYYYKNAQLLDVNLKNSYNLIDERLPLMQSKNVDKDNAPFVKWSDTFDPITGKAGYDFPILRYSDVYLMLAEAANEIAYNPDPREYAFYYLNQVRSRAKASRYTSTILSDQDSFRKAVLEERRLEFPLEMHRWFDLIRTNTAEEALAKKGLTITKNDYLFPIPKTEVDIVNDPIRFPQNPGYGSK